MRMTDLERAVAGVSREFGVTASSIGHSPDVDEYEVVIRLPVIVERFSLPLEAVEDPEAFVELFAQAQKKLFDRVLGYLAKEERS